MPTPFKIGDMVEWWVNSAILDSEKKYTGTITHITMSGILKITATEDFAGTFHWSLQDNHFDIAKVNKTLDEQYMEAF